MVFTLVIGYPHSPLPVLGGAYIGGEVTHLRCRGNFDLGGRSGQRRRSTVAAQVAQRGTSPNAGVSAGLGVPDVWIR